MIAGLFLRNSIYYLYFQKKILLFFSFFFFCFCINKNIKSFVFVCAVPQEAKCTLQKSKPPHRSPPCFEYIWISSRRQLPIIITPLSSSPPNNLPTRVTHPPTTPSSLFFHLRGIPRPSFHQNLYPHSQSSDLSPPTISEMSPFLRSRCSDGSSTRPTVPL